MTVVGTTPPPGPVANPDSAVVGRNSSNNPIDVLANDVGKDLTITAVTQGVNGGTVAIVPAAANTSAVSRGSVTYTPSANYLGSDSFTYTITDANGASATGNVSVTIVMVDPLPVIANPDSARIPENAPATKIDVLANDIGAGLTITAVTQGANGAVTIAADSLSVSYAPAANFVGVDDFTYTITNSTGASATGKVEVTVVAPPPPPPPPPTIQANPDFAKVLKNSSANLIDVLANDIGTGLSITAVTQGANGTVAIVASPAANAGSLGGAVSYSPAANYSGPDSFTYTITDASSATATGTVSVYVGQRQSRSGCKPGLCNHDEK